MNIYFLGPLGSYSGVVARKMFRLKKYKLVPVNEFQDVVERTKKDGIGILGIENSITSSVHECVDYMFAADFYIIGEVMMNVDLYLGAKTNSNLSEINQVFSHPQALLQCSTFIDRHGFQINKTTSTATAINHVVDSNDLKSAAIGDAESLKKSGLEILAKNIGNCQNNMTRWIIISKNKKSLEQPINKTTYIFKVLHESGSLVKVLTAIASAGGNMTKIESRPVAGSDWEYEFWVEVEVENRKLIALDKAINENTLNFRKIGAYKKGKLYTNNI